MLVDVRPAHRLRGAKRLDVPAALGPIMEALSEGSVDLSRLRIVCDWVQYKENFRDVIDVRPILATDPAGPVGNGAVPARELELAVDLRRTGDVPIGEVVRRALAGTADRVYLEDWAPTSLGCIWRFNALYWSALNLWEEATGRGYEQALPGGETDARNIESVREIIEDLFVVWDDLAARNSLPGELYVVELGVGNGNQARTWLDVFREMDHVRGTRYYRRLQYLMCDYSPHVLELARAAVAPHAEHVSSFVLDATSPTTALGMLRYKVFLVYISNVYDNLPTEEVARIGGRVYGVQARAYLPRADADRIAATVGIETTALPALVAKLLRLGPVLLADAMPDRFGDVRAAVALWQQSWQALKLAERYVPLCGLDSYEICRKVSGEALRPLLEADGDIRMHVNNGAMASFMDTVTLLVCYGNRHARPSWEGHYDFLFPAVLDAHVDQLVLEFARKGFDDLKLIERFGWDRSLGLGVIDVKNEEVESPILVAARIRRALDVVPAERLVVNPDCGLRHLPTPVARAKMDAMVAGTAAVRREIAGARPDDAEQTTEDEKG